MQQEDYVLAETALVDAGGINLEAATFEEEEDVFGHGGSLWQGELTKHDQGPRDDGLEPLRAGGAEVEFGGVADGSSMKFGRPKGNANVRGAVGERQGVKKRRMARERFEEWRSTTADRLQRAENKRGLNRCLRASGGVKELRRIQRKGGRLGRGW